LIEGDLRFGAGTYVFFKPGSSHRPRSEKGVRLFGFNLANGSPQTAKFRRRPARPGRRN
jgi:hypothetical protein